MIDGINTHIQRLALYNRTGSGYRNDEQELLSSPTDSGT
jgi:hypothetical protein